MTGAPPTVREDPARARAPAKHAGRIAASLVLLASIACSGSTDARSIAILRAVPGSDDGQDPFRSTLHARGWVTDTNLRIFAADPTETYPSAGDAREVVGAWVAAGVDLIFAQSTVGAQIARDVAPGVPVIFLVNDPVAVGLVTDEESPEGDLTGVTFRVPADRTLDLARRAMGGRMRAGYLFPANDDAALPHRRAIRDAARRLNIPLRIASFADEATIDDAVRRLARQRADLIVVANAPTAARAIRTIERSAMSAGVPTVINGDFGRDSLIMLSPDTAELLRQAGRQAARLLQGTPVADVPVEDPRSYILTINERSAGALGIRLPQDLYDEADTVLR